MALPVVPLRERVVEIEVALGTGRAERYRYGSGFRLGGRRVLTAAHVVAGAAGAGIMVRGPDKAPHPARVVDGLAGDPDTVDLALLELCDQTAELSAPPVAAVDRDAPVPVPVEGCWAVGYPLFQEVESAAGVVRETAQVWGMILPAENLVGGLLSLQVTSAPRALPPRQEALGESQWSGMSGAAVLAGERLIGVVSEHAPRRGESTITVTPLASISQLPAAAAARWWEHLAADPGQLVMLPARRGPAEPAYRATLRQLRARTGVLQGRDGELAAVGAFAAGQPSALAPPGSQHAWLAGGPWAGKTALLAEAVHALPPQVDCVAYFLTRPTGDADRERFLAAVVPQLAWLLGTDPPSTPDEHVLRQLWEQAAQRAADEDRQLLLVVDGLDEDLRPGGHSVAGWLPGRLPGLPARVLVASRRYPRLPDDVDPAHPLAALAPDQLYTLPDSPHAARVRELAGQEITRLLRRASDDLALDVLGLLTAARGGPLAAADLATLTSSRPWKVRGVLDGDAGRTLQQVGPADTPRYTFAHETLLARCQEQGVDDPGHAHRIEEWAATWRDRGWPAAGDGEQGTPLYLLDRYPQTLYGDPPRLAALAGDPRLGHRRHPGPRRRRGAGRTENGGCRCPRPAAAGSHARRGAGPSPPPARPGSSQRSGVRAAPAVPPGDRTRRNPPRRGLPDPAACLRRPWPGAPVDHTTRKPSPLIFELGRDRGGVEAAAVLPDGRVITGGERVLVWDPAEPGTGPVELGRDEDGVAAVAVLPDGRVVTGGRSGRVLVWDPAEPGTGPVELGRDELGVNAVAVLPDGRVVTGGRGERVVTDGRGARVLVWDPAEPGTGPVELGRHEGAMVEVGVLPDGRVEFGPDAFGVGAVAVLPDGRVVTGGRGDRVLVWDPAEPGAGPAELGLIRSGVWAVAVLPDGRVITGGVGWLVVWDPANWGAGPVEFRRDEDPVAAVAVLPDGRVVTGSGFPLGPGRVVVWDPAEPGVGPVELGRDELGVEAVAVLPDGRLVTGGRGGRVRLWDPGAAQRDPVEPGCHDGTEMAVAVLPDGRVVTGSGRRVLVWDPAEAGTSPVELGRDELMVGAVAVLPDGRVVTGGAFPVAGGRVLVWDPAEAGAGPVELGRHERGVAAVAVLPDGRVVTGGGYGGGGLRVWDPAEPGTGPVEFGRDEDLVVAVAVLPDGRVVTGGIFATGGRVLVWDLAEPGTGPVELGRDGFDVVAVAVLPDGRVVTGGGSRRVRLWDPAEPGAGPVELGRHEGGVSTVAVLPDGRVVTGSYVDGRVQLRNVHSSSPGTLLACSAYALATSLSPSGARLFIGHAAGGISCWELRLAT